MVLLIPNYANPLRTKDQLVVLQSLGSVALGSLAYTAGLTAMRAWTEVDVLRRLFVARMPKARYMVTGQIKTHSKW